jgi:hypothetical protein
MTDEAVVLLFINLSALAAEWAGRIRFALYAAEIEERSRYSKLSLQFGAESRTRDRIELKLCGQAKDD